MKFPVLSVGLMAGLTVAAPTLTVDEVAEVGKRATITDASFLYSPLLPAC